MSDIIVIIVILFDNQSNIGYLPSSRWELPTLIGFSSELIMLKWNGYGNYFL